MSNGKIKIASIVPYKIFPPKMGGQKAIAFFYQYLEKILPLTLITIAENDANGFIKSPVIHTLGRNSKWRYINPLLFFKLRTFLKHEKITHLIIEHPYYGWLGILLKWFTKVKLIIRSHNIEAKRFQSMGYWWWTVLWQYEKLSHRQADLSLFITEEDRQYALKHFGLSEEKTSVITYGIEIKNSPSKEEKTQAKNLIKSKYGIAEDEKILLFNGTLNYAPNREALNVILNEINPLLLKQGYKYKLLICGKGLPEKFNDLKDYKSQNIIYAGFVDDIDSYFKASDIFINPVLDGGGIKTKLVEALGFNVSVVSTVSGAIGIPTSITADKLKIVADDNWDLFAKEIMNSNSESLIPEEFFDHFYWGNIVEKAAKSLY